MDSVNLAMSPVSSLFVESAGGAVGAGNRYHQLPSPQTLSQGAAPIAVVSWPQQEEPFPKGGYTVSAGFD